MADSQLVCLPAWLLAVIAMTGFPVGYLVKNWVGIGDPDEAESDSDD